ncbi:MAG: LamG domain-containing protein, partial [Candidatus Aenigmatarchaeota archaeon]
IEAVSGKQITIRNTGQTPITNFAIYVDEKPVNFTNSSKIVNPGEIYTFFVYDFIDYSYPRTLKITIPGIVQTKQVGKENSDPSLVGYWKFDEGSGTIAYDSSIYGNDGQLVNNPQWVDGKYGKALNFTGANNVSANNLLVNTSLNAKNTVEFWMNWTGSQGVMPFGWNTAYDLYINCGCLGFNTGDSNVLGTSNSYMANNLIYVVAVFHNGLPSSTNNTLYINGTKVDISECCSSITGSSKSVTEKIFISGWGASAGYYFRGIIDEVRIWNRALTPEEVLNHYLHGPV